MSHDHVTTSARRHLFIYKASIHYANRKRIRDLQSSKVMFVTTALFPYRRSLHQYSSFKLAYTLIVITLFLLFYEKETQKSISYNQCSCNSVFKLLEYIARFAFDLHLNCEYNITCSRIIQIWFHMVCFIASFM